MALFSPRPSPGSSRSCTDLQQVFRDGFYNPGKQRRAKRLEIKNIERTYEHTGGFHSTDELSPDSELKDQAKQRKAEDKAQRKAEKQGKVGCARIIFAHEFRWRSGKTGDVEGLREENRRDPSGSP